MSEKKQIAKIIAENFMDGYYSDEDFEQVAEKLQEAGWHKQSEGEWVMIPVDGVARYRCGNINAWSNPVVPDVVGVIIDRSPTADVAPRSEWISVEERLPDSGCRCLAWSLDYVWLARFASYNYGIKGWHVVCGGRIKDTKMDGVKVTHWMPLPEPPVTKGE